MTPSDRRLPAVTQAQSMRLVGHSGLGGRGDCMQVSLAGRYAYVGHQGSSDAGTSIVDVSDPTDPRLVGRLPRPTGTMTHKTQVVGDTLIVNHQRSRYENPPPGGWSAGLAIYDISQRENPRQVAFFETPGIGVHRMAFWSKPYAYISATAPGFLGRILIILDLADPARPTEVGRWWLPGQHLAAGEPPSWGPALIPSGGSEERDVKLHHAVVRGDRAYCGWTDAGMVILDVADKSAPRLVSHLDLGPESRFTHTALPIPGRDLVVTTDEQFGTGADGQRFVFVVDTSDESHPRVISRFPQPVADSRQRGVRFGPHNLHEMAPGTLVDPNTIYLTYFGGGVRVFDIENPLSPREIAYLIPEPPAGQRSIEFNDLTVNEDRVIFATDRVHGGLYVIEHLG
jgi:hypothetical protein